MPSTRTQLVLVGLLLSTHLLYAQEKDKSLDEVVITASKFPQKQDQSGKVLTVLTDSLLRSQAGRSLLDVLNTQAGLVVVGSGQPLGSVQTPFLRGAGAGSSLILVDGVPVFDPSAISNAFDLNLIPLEQIERIEIMKGGQSTLYGSDAVAGVIHIITKKTGSKPFQVSTTLSAGSFGTFRGDATVSGKSTKWKYIAGISQTNSQGFSAADASKSSEPFEKDGFAATSAHGTLTRFVSEKASFYGKFLFSQYRADIDEGAFADDHDFVSNNTNIQMGSGYTYQGKKWDWTAHYLFTQSNRSSINDSIFVPITAFSSYSEANFASKAHFAEWVSSWRFHPNFTLLSGLDIRQQSMSQDYFSISHFGRYDDTPIVFAQASILNTSIFASLNSQELGKFGFEIGGRLNQHSIYNFNTSYTINPYWVIHPQFKAFLSIANSFKNPSLYQIYSAYGNLDLQPEIAQTYDLGMQFSGKKSKNYIRGVYFRRAIRNVIFFQSLSIPPYGQYINLNKQQDQGVEIDGQLFVQNWHFSGNYTFTTGESIENQGGTEIRTYNLLRRPKHGINTTIGYQISSKWTVGVQGQYFSNRTDRFFNTNTFASEEVNLPAYFLVNLQAGYAIHTKVKAFASIQNALNTRYTEIYGFSSRPFSIQSGLQMQF